MPSVARRQLVPLLLLLLPLLADGLDDGMDDNYEGWLAHPAPPPPPAAGGSGVAGEFASRTCKFSPRGTGLSFDLSGMQRLDHDYTGTTAGGYAYRFNVCGDTLKICNAVPAPASKWRGTKCNNLGDEETMKLALLDPKEPASGLKLSFDQGDICKKQGPNGEAEMGSRFMSYEVACAHGEPGRLVQITEVSMCEYVIQFESESACPIGSTGGGGGYVRFLLFLIFCFAAYLSGGIAYNIKYQSQQGLDALPHREFWREVPTLVHEGVHFSYEQSKEAYETKLKPAYESHVQPHVESLREKVMQRARSEPIPAAA